MRPARLQRKRRDRGVIDNPRPRSARAPINEIVHFRRDAPVIGAHQHDDAMRADGTRPTRHTWQIVGDANTEIVAGPLDLIARVVEQRLCLPLIRHFNRIGAETYANARLARGRSRAPKTRQFGRRFRAGATGGRKGQAKSGKMRSGAHKVMAVRWYG